MHRFILVITKATGRRAVIEYTPGDLGAIYASADLARLAIGLTVDRGTVTHTDLDAFHARMTNPVRSHVVSLDAIRARLAARRAQTLGGPHPLNLAPFRIAERA